jgi:hypothetical protein
MTVKAPVSSRQTAIDVGCAHGRQATIALHVAHVAKVPAEGASGGDSIAPQFLQVRFMVRATIVASARGGAK